MSRQEELLARSDVHRTALETIPPPQRRAEPAGVALCCTTCQDTYEPSSDDWETGHTGCRWCGGWTFIAAVS